MEKQASAQEPRPLSANQTKRQRRRQRKIKSRLRKQMEQIAREIIEEIRNEGNEIPIDISLLMALYDPFIFGIAEFVDFVTSYMEEYIPLTVPDCTVPSVEEAKVV